LPCLNSGGALRSLIRPRWIGLAAVQCVLLWSIPKAGADLPQSPTTAITQATSQALTKSAVDIYFIQEKRYGSDEDPTVRDWTAPNPSSRIRGFLSSLLIINQWLRLKGLHYSGWLG
jgi:hypothetical protein